MTNEVGNHRHFIVGAPLVEFYQGLHEVKTLGKILSSYVLLSPQQVLVIRVLIPHASCEILFVCRHFTWLNPSLMDLTRDELWHSLPWIEPFLLSSIIENCQIVDFRLLKMKILHRLTNGIMPILVIILIVWAIDHFDSLAINDDFCFGLFPGYIHKVLKPLQVINQSSIEAFRFISFCLNQRQQSYLSIEVSSCCTMAKIEIRNEAIALNSKRP
jgi:hypothetical protein